MESLSNLPDCAFDSLRASVQGPGIVKLEWDRIDCANIGDDDGGGVGGDKNDGVTTTTAAE